MQDRPWTPAFIALGSNLDQPRRRVDSAIEAISTGIPHTRLVATSRLYGSRAVGPGQQPDYVNAVTAVLTQLDPESLLSALLALESALGRRRDGSRWGPRHIDLDLLLHGDNVRNGELLQLPHPELANRQFVLRPLADLAPAWRLPDGRQVAGLLNDAGDGQVWEL